LMESYVIGLAEVPKEKGGWAEAKRERGLNLVKSLSSHLGDAERLSSSTFPLSSGYMRLMGSTTAFTPHCPFDGFTTHLPSRYSPLAHVRSERMDVGSNVGDCGMVFPRLRSFDIGRRRSIWSFRCVLSHLLHMMKADKKKTITHYPVTHLRSYMNP
jgi:hypothetical protein